jgi:transposase
VCSTPAGARGGRCRRGTGGRDHRHVVERCFNKRKQWRGVAMRSDDAARAYRAATALAATLI